MDLLQTYSAFAGERLLVTGTLRAMLSATKTFLDENEQACVLIFEDQTGKQLDFNFSGTLDQVLERGLPAPARTGPGRPKLGVISREVSLLPRHWEWLEREPHGISAALRRLVDEAKKRDPGEQQARLGREAVSRFITAMAGNLEHFEEASRALFANDQPRFEKLIENWPGDVRRHALRVLEESSQP